MPLPKPKKDESHDDFIDRCMGDDVMNDEYPDKGQRYQVCENLWDKEKKDALNLPDLERRVMPMDLTELRVEGDQAPKLVGYAAKFNTWSVDLGGFREKIRRGAFAEALGEADVRCLKNHDPNLILGRTTNQTLRLSENTVGLRFEDDLPDTSTGRDTQAEVRRGDISGCSFSFTVAEDEWKFSEEAPPERTITKIGMLFDVGPVTFPAYPDTTVAARSLAAARAAQGIVPAAPPETEAANESKTIDPERQRQIGRGYRTAGRILNRCRTADDRPAAPDATSQD